MSAFDDVTSSDKIDLLERAVLDVVQKPVRTMIETLIQELSPVSELSELSEYNGSKEDVDDAELAATRVMSRHQSTLTKHSLGVRCMVSHGDNVYTAGADFKVNVWKSSNCQVTSTLNHGATVTCMAIKADGSRLYTASSNRSLKMWALPSGTLMQTVSGREPISLFLSGNSLFGGHSKCLKVWSADTLEEISSLTG